MALIDQFKLNLEHYNLWTNVTIHNDHIASGIPPEKLLSTDSKAQLEWVVCGEKQHQLSIKVINTWFKQIQNLNDKKERPKRITIGIMNDDGTIVYYFIHDGITKPRQN